MNNFSVMISQLSILPRRKPRARDIGTEGRLCLIWLGLCTLVHGLEIDEVVIVQMVVMMSQLLNVIISRLVKCLSYVLQK